MKTSLLLVLAMAALACAEPRREKKRCDFEDDQCLTKFANRTFVDLISGRSGVEPSDPLHTDLIVANLPTLKFNYTNNFLYGMKNCHVELVRLSVKTMKYNYHIECPHLVQESKCKIKGQLGPNDIEGSGTCKVDFYDYHIYFNGDYEKYVASNGKAYIRVKNHNLELDAKGKVHFLFDNLFNGDNEKSEALHKFINENCQFVDKLTRQPVMDSFMGKYMENVKTYLDLTPLEDLFVEE